MMSMMSGINCGLQAMHGRAPFPRPKGAIGRRSRFGCTIVALLSLLGLGLEAGHANPNLPEPLFQEGKLPPEETDGPFRYWTRRKKYFLVIAVNQTDVAKTDLPFAQVDGHLVADALSGLGYQPLDPIHPILTGQDGTASAIMARLDEARRKEEEAILIVYYTGHGAVGPKDLWLQTAGQEKVGDGQGVKVSDLVVQVRQTASGKAFEGELVLILDACYSGQGTVAQGLTLGDLGKRTTILTSSTEVQESFSLNPPVVPKRMSAFTYTFIQGLGSAWAEADRDSDGILRWEELKIYAALQLRILNENGALMKPMTPSLLTNYSEGFLSYRRDQVRSWRSSYRTLFTTQATNEILAASLQRPETDATDAKEVKVLKEAQLLAKNVEPAPDDFYAQAVTATAEGKMENARVFFAKALAQSHERAATAEAARQREMTRQGEIHLAHARMEMYDGNFDDALSLYQQAAKLSPSTTPELLNEIGLAALRAGKYPESENYLTQALTRRERELPPEHADLATSLNNLGVLYKNQGRYAKAEPLYKRALKIREATLGPEHPDVGESLNNLGVLYKHQLLYEMAERHFKRALHIHEAQDPDNPDVATDLNNLAGIYYAEREYATAESLQKRVLRINETALGPDHPNVGRTVGNLAMVYQAQGKYSEAEPLFQRSFWILFTKLGPNHPSVSEVWSNYRVFLKASGQPHDKDNVWKKLHASSYAQPGTVPLP
jgi:tetratricopeptide (TPR) repeat protein